MTMHEKLKALLEKRKQLAEDAKKILTTADAEKRNTTAEEDANFDRIHAEISAASKDIDKLDRQLRLEAELKEPRERLADPRSSEPLAPVAVGEPLTIKLRDRQVTIGANTPLHVSAQPAYRKSFVEYLSSGIAAGMQSNVDNKGGYLAPVTLSTQIIKFLDDLVFMRRISHVLPPLTQSVSLGVVSWDADPGDADWTPEVPAADIPEDDAARTGKREFTPHLLTKLIKLSQKLLRVSIIDIESFISQRLAYKFAVTEERAFLYGDGAHKPLGIFVASADGIPTTRDSTAASGTVFVPDELITLKYTLKESYRRNASWVIHRDFIARAAKMKDASGRYIWNIGGPGDGAMVPGQPATLLGMPVYESEFAPSTFTTGQYIAVLGDFKAGYWIVDSLDFAIQRLNELFTLRNQIGLKAMKETDGMPVLGEAFARLKLG